MNTPTTSMVMPRRGWRLGVGIPLFLTACVATGSDRDTEGIDIGYGEVDEEQVDGSIETVDAREEGLARTRALADMLRRLPGVRVSVEGDDLTVRIRASSSFLASEAPLVVMDGMEYRGSLTSINPFNIESITVLKNAGETAVYGARGANGVILITTKRGPESGEA